MEMRLVEYRGCTVLILANKHFRRGSIGKGRNGCRREFLCDGALCGLDGYATEFSDEA